MTIPSARFRFTALPASGERSRWACLPAGNTARQGRFAPDNSAPLKGLFYGGGTQVLVAQAIGSACITLATFAVAMVVMLAVNATGTLRLPEEAELYGMDLHEHGISAYPEYVISTLGAPGGMPKEQVNLTTHAATMHSSTAKLSTT